VATSTIACAESSSRSSCPEPQRQRALELAPARAYPVLMAPRARKRCKVTAPTPEDEEAAFVRSLETHGQAVEGKGPLPPGATHRISLRKDGEKRVRRKRFAAA
jgi:hypothetical protein